ncbi:unnamed protein product [Amoebophrya sp. A120]|nr:unnamed protein product [Amoebophrya sp. A120]|eukprot:GSA120T00012393001.1
MQDLQMQDPNDHRNRNPFEVERQRLEGVNAGEQEDEIDCMVGGQQHIGDVETGDYDPALLEQPLDHEQASNKRMLDSTTSDDADYDFDQELDLDQMQIQVDENCSSAGTRTTGCTMASSTTSSNNSGGGRSDKEAADIAQLVSDCFSFDPAKDKTSSLEEDKILNLEQEQENHKQSSSKKKISTEQLYTPSAQPVLKPSTSSKPSSAQRSPAVSPPAAMNEEQMKITEWLFKSCVGIPQRTSISPSVSVSPNLNNGNKSGRGNSKKSGVNSTAGGGGSCSSSSNPAADRNNANLSATEMNNIMTLLTGGCNKTSTSRTTAGANTKRNNAAGTSSKISSKNTANSNRSSRSSVVVQKQRSLQQASGPTADEFDPAAIPMVGGGGESQEHSSDSNGAVEHRNGGSPAILEIPAGATTTGDLDLDAILGLTAARQQQLQQYANYKNSISSSSLIPGSSQHHQQHSSNKQNQNLISFKLNKTVSSCSSGSTACSSGGSMSTASSTLVDSARTTPQGAHVIHGTTLETQEQVQQFLLNVGAGAASVPVQNVVSVSPVLVSTENGLMQVIDGTTRSGAASSTTSSGAPAPGGTAAPVQHQVLANLVRQPSKNSNKTKQVIALGGGGSGGAKKQKVEEVQQVGVVQHPQLPRGAGQLILHPPPPGTSTAAISMLQQHQDLQLQRTHSQSNVSMISTTASSTFTQTVEEYHREADKYSEEWKKNLFLSPPPESRFECSMQGTDMNDQKMATFHKWLNEILIGVTQSRGPLVNAMVDFSGNPDLTDMALRKLLVVLKRSKVHVKKLVLNKTGISDVSMQNLLNFLTPKNNSGQQHNAGVEGGILSSSQNQQHQRPIEHICFESCPNVTENGVLILLRHFDQNPLYPVRKLLDNKHGKQDVQYESVNVQAKACENMNYVNLFNRIQMETKLSYCFDDRIAYNRNPLKCPVLMFSGGLNPGYTGGAGRNNLHPNSATTATSTAAGVLLAQQHQNMIGAAPGAAGGLQNYNHLPGGYNLPPPQLQAQFQNVYTGAIVGTVPIGPELHHLGTTTSTLSSFGGMQHQLHAAQQNHSSYGSQTRSCANHVDPSASTAAGTTAAATRTTTPDLEDQDPLKAVQDIIGEISSSTKAGGKNTKGGRGKDGASGVNATAFPGGGDRGTGKDSHSAGCTNGGRYRANSHCLQMGDTIGPPPGKGAVVSGGKIYYSTPAPVQGNVPRHNLNHHGSSASSYGSYQHHSTAACAASTSTTFRAPTGSPHHHASSSSSSSLFGGPCASGQAHEDDQHHESSAGFFPHGDPQHEHASGDQHHFSLSRGVPHGVQPQHSRGANMNRSRGRSRSRMRGRSHARGTRAPGRGGIFGNQLQGQHPQQNGSSRSRGGNRSNSNIKFVPELSSRSGTSTTVPGVASSSSSGNRGSARQDLGLLREEFQFMENEHEEDVDHLGTTSNTGYSAGMMLKGAASAEQHEEEEYDPFSMTPYESKLLDKEIQLMKMEERMKELERENQQKSSGGGVSISSSSTIQHGTASNTSTNTPRHGAAGDLALAQAAAAQQQQQNRKYEQLLLEQLVLRKREQEQLKMKSQELELLQSRLGSFVAAGGGIMNKTGGAAPAVGAGAATASSSSASTTELEPQSGNGQQLQQASAASRADVVNVTRTLARKWINPQSLSVDEDSLKCLPFVKKGKLVRKVKEITSPEDPQPQINPITSIAEEQEEDVNEEDLDGVPLEDHHAVEVNINNNIETGSQPPTSGEVDIKIIGEGDVEMKEVKQTSPPLSTTTTRTSSTTCTSIDHSYSEGGDGGSSFTEHDNSGLLQKSPEDLLDQNLNREDHDHLQRQSLNSVGGEEGTSEKQDVEQNQNENAHANPFHINNAFLEVVNQMKTTSSKSACSPDLEQSVSFTASSSTNATKSSTTQQPSFTGPPGQAEPQKNKSEEKKMHQDLRIQKPTTTTVLEFDNKKHDGTTVIPPVMIRNASSIVPVEERMSKEKREFDLKTEQLIHSAKVANNAVKRNVLPPPPRTPASNMAANNGGTTIGFFPKNNFGGDGAAGSTSSAAPAVAAGERSSRNQDINRMKDGSRSTTHRSATGGNNAVSTSVLKPPGRA